MVAILREPKADRVDETAILHAIRERLGKETDLVLWRNALATGERWDEKSGRTAMFRGGLGEGSSDLVGLLAPAGRLVALEVKSAKGRLLESQAQFLSLVRRMGGFACVVRSVAEAVAAIDRARLGALE